MQTVFLRCHGIDSGRLLLQSLLQLFVFGLATVTIHFFHKTLHLLELLFFFTFRSILLHRFHLDLLVQIRLLHVDFAF